MSYLTVYLCLPFKHWSSPIEGSTDVRPSSLHTVLMFPSTRFMPMVFQSHHLLLTMRTLCAVPECLQNMCWLCWSPQQCGACHAHKWTHPFHYVKWSYSFTDSCNFRHTNNPGFVLHSGYVMIYAMEARRWCSLHLIFSTLSRERWKVEQGSGICCSQPRSVGHPARQNSALSFKTVLSPEYPFSKYPRLKKYRKNWKDT